MGRICGLGLPAPPAAAATVARRLGREGGQPGSDLLCQPQQPLHTVETALQHVRQISVLMCFRFMILCCMKSPPVSRRDVISETESDNRQRQIHQEAHRVFRSRRHISEDLENEHLEPRDIDNVREQILYIYIYTQSCLMWLCIISVWLLGLLVVVLGAHHRRGS